jgi:hypothetical protein
MGVVVVWDTIRKYARPWERLHGDWNLKIKVRI